nr:uncharacterized protein LOC131775212 isoform X2 [Pocillopora verrucosa]
MYVENLERDNSLKGVLFIKVSGQITSDTLWKKALDKNDAEYNKEVTSLKSDASTKSRFSSWSWKAWKESKKSLFFIVLFTVCLVLIFSEVARARFETALWDRDLKRETSFDGIVYLLIIKFCVGTVLLVTLYDLIDSNYAGKKDKATISIVPASI